MATSSVVMSSLSTVSCGASAAQGLGLRLGLGGGDDRVAPFGERQAAPFPNPDPAPVIMTVLLMVGHSSVAAVPAL